MSLESKAYLAILGFLWSGYGSYCYFNPTVLETFCGMKLDSKADSSHFLIELKAMYGGLQFAFGLHALNTLYVLLKEKSPPTELSIGILIGTLRAYSFVMGIIGISRLIAVLQEGKSIAPKISFEVFGEKGLTALLPLYYNSNAIWCFELPGGIAAYILAQRELSRLNDNKKR